MAASDAAFTEENLVALKKAMAEGVRRVKYTDKEIEYRSLDEMIKLQKRMERELYGKKCGKPGLFGGRRIVGRHSKGLNTGDCE